VYLRCPECGQLIKEPFNADGGPQVFTHHRARRSNCRLVVVPSEQVALIVPHGTALEAALAREITRRVS
jgi:hypothetical protein